MRIVGISCIALALCMSFGFSVFAQSMTDDMRISVDAESISTTRQTSNKEASLEVSSAEANPNIMLARSSADYMVTPGDVYTLAYAAGSAPISYTITVDTSYRVRVSNLGVVNGAGKTFPQLRREVETIVANNYPLSGVQLALSQPSVFMVYINGEVYSAGERSAWALTRLSTLAGGNLTGLASLRDISIKSSNGQTRVYDLFKAQRLGDIGQNPYLRPGDEVTFNRIKRTVTINGSVERPGTYQLLDGENIKELVEYYGNGFTPVADKSRARLVRYVGSAEISGDITWLTEQELTGNYTLQDMDVISVPAITALRPAVPVNRMERTVTISGAVRRPGTYELRPDENLKELIDVYADGFLPIADQTRMEMVRLIKSSDIAGDKIFLTLDDLANNYELEHFDAITVPSITHLMPVMFVEGAIILESDKRTEETGTELTASNRIVVQFNSGETYASVVRRYNWFSSVSDTQNAYIIRGDQRIPINLNLMLYDASYRDEVLVQENDVLVVPFRQYFVSVAGAVYTPGRYPFIPDRDWEYYIGLAGGFLPGRNSLEAVTITNMSGKRMKKTDAISPETIITANTNHPLFAFNQYAPVITTVLSIATTLISIILIAGR